VQADDEAKEYHQCNSDSFFMPYFENFRFAVCLYVARKLASKQSKAEKNILSTHLHR